MTDPQPSLSSIIVAVSVVIAVVIVVIVIAGNSCIYDALYNDLHAKSYYKHIAVHFV